MGPLNSGFLIRLGIFLILLSSMMFYLYQQKKEETSEHNLNSIKNLEEYIQLLPYLPDDKFLKLFKEFHLNHGFINKNKVIEVCNQRFYKALDEEYEKRFL